MWEFHVGGDLVEEVKLIDEFENKKKGKTSNCFRITYRSMERSLTDEEINAIQEKVREEVQTSLGVELRWRQSRRRRGERRRRKRGSQCRSKLIARTWEGIGLAYPAIWGQKGRRDGGKRWGSIERRMGSVKARSGSA
jgi:hypothetical protein